MLLGWVSNKHGSMPGEEATSATLLQATIELGTQVPNVIAGDRIADADELAVLVRERVEVVLGEIRWEHLSERLPTGLVVGVSEYDVDGQPKIAFSQHVFHCFTVNVAQDQHEVGLWIESLHFAQDHPKLVSTGAFTVPVDAGVRLGVDHKREQRLVLSCLVNFGSVRRQ